MIKAQIVGDKWEGYRLYTDNASFKSGSHGIMWELSEDFPVQDVSEDFVARYNRVMAENRKLQDELEKMAGK